MTYVRGAGFKIEGLNELQSQFERVGKMKKKYLSKAAREGSNDPLRDARTSAPKGKTGLLKKGIHRKMETPNKRSKAVYRIRWNPKYTEHYLKPTTGVYGGKTPFAYYPHSVEYGYKTKRGRIDGRYFVTKAIEKNEKQSTQKVVDSLNKSITQIINQG